jgi:hypothetical protein
MKKVDWFVVIINAFSVVLYVIVERINGTRNYGVIYNYAVMIFLYASQSRWLYKSYKRENELFKILENILGTKVRITTKGEGVDGKT